MYEVVKRSMQLKGAAHSAYRELFDEVVKSLPEHQQEELQWAYRDVLAAERDTLGAELDEELNSKSPR